jgi:hypothetical protein
MNAAFKLLKRHTVAFILYILYTLLCINNLTMWLQFQERLKHRQPGQSGIALGGEGVAFADFFLIIIGIIFILSSFINATVRKTGTSFYLWLSLIVFVQTMAILNIEGFHF